MDYAELERRVRQMEATLAAWDSDIWAGLRWPTGVRFNPREGFVSQFGKFDFRSSGGVSRITLDEDGLTAYYAGTLRARVGNLADITDPLWGALSGWGFYAYDIAYLNEVHLHTIHLYGGGAVYGAATDYLCYAPSPDEWWFMIGGIQRFRIGETDAEAKGDFTVVGTLTAAALSAPHVMGSAGSHSGSGLTIGHVVRASGATAFDWAELQHSDLGGVTADLHHAQAHVLATSGPHTGTLPWAELSKTGSDLADLAARAHASLTGVTADLHHAQAHVLATSGPHTGTLPWTDLSKTGSDLADLASRAHSSLTGVTSDLHHAQAHVVDSSGPHSGSGLTAGHVLKATSATAFAFGQLQHSQLGGVTADLHHAQAHVLATSGPHSGTLPWTDLSKTGSDLADLATRAHGSLTGVGANDHHDELHNVVSTGPHSESGLTVGHVLKATSVTAFSFGQLQHSQLGGVGASDHHAKYLNSEAIAAVEGATFSSLKAATFYYTGNVSLDAFSAGAHTTVYVQNTDGTYQADLNVEKNIIVGGVVDGVDLAAFKTAYDAHAHGAGDPTQIAHANLTGVTSSLHHVRYANSEAVTAIQALATIELGDITLDGTNRRITFATGDYYQFNTGSNYWEWVISSNQKLKLDTNYLYVNTYYGLQLTGTTRRVTFATGDYLQYDTANNKYEFRVGSAVKAEVSTTGLTLPNASGNACFLEGLIKGLHHEFHVNPGQMAAATYTWYDVTGASVSWTSYTTEDLLILVNHNFNRNGANALSAIYMGSKLDAAGENTLIRINMTDDWPTDAGIWFENNVASGSHTWKLRFKVTETLIKVQTQRGWVIRLKH